MAVFPESMDRLNVENTTGSLSILENYIRYMQERVEFSMQNMTRTVSEAGVSSVTIYILLNALQDSVASLTSEVQRIAGDVSELKANHASMSASISAMQEELSGVRDSVTALQGSVEALEERVTALETTESL